MNKIAHFYCYGIIGEADPMFQAFTGQPDPIISAAKVAEFLNSIDKGVDEIIIHLNSRGGSVYEGFAIHDLFSTSGKKITTIAEGLVASIATVVFLAGSQRKITENSQLMIHNPWIDPMLISGLTADEIQQMADNMKVEENRIVDFYASKTKVEKSTLSEMMKEETFISSDKALELKFATEIVTPVKAFATLKLKQHLNTNNDHMNKLFSSIEKKIDAIMNFQTGKSKTIDIKASAKTTTDGKTINIEGDVAVGSMVTDDSGNPTPNASYTLEDGTVIKTDADSKISEVTPSANAQAQVKVGDILKNEAGELLINAEHKISDTITAKTNDKGEVIELIDAAQAPDVNALNEKITTLEASIAAKDEEIASFKLAQAEIEKKINIIAKNIQSTHIVKPGATNLRKPEGEVKENRIKALKETIKKEKEKTPATV